MEIRAKDLEERSQCNVCGARNFRILTSVYLNSINEICFQTSLCRNCGSTVRTRHPALSWFESLEATFEDIYDRKWEMVRAYRYDRYRSKLRKRIKKDGAVLDIGSSTGIGLNRFQNKGYSVYGVEQDRKRAEFSRPVLGQGVDIFSGSFENYQPARKFDLVLLIHVLEHLADPYAILTKIHSLLGDNGVLYVEVPNLYKSIDYRDSFYLSHMINFTKGSLSRLLESTGFKVEENLSSIFTNYDGTAIGFACVKRSGVKSAKLKVDSRKVDRIFSCKGCPSLPIVYQMNALSEMSDAPRRLFVFDENNGRYLISEKAVPIRKCLTLGQLVRKLRIKILQSLIATYAGIKYRNYIKKVDAVFLDLSSQSRKGDHESQAGVDRTAAAGK